jgi:hypothetical protein
MMLRSPLLAVLLAAVACTHGKPPAPVPPAEHARAPSGPKQPPYRFVALGGSPVHGVALEGGAVGVIEGALRSVVALDGAVEKAHTVAPAFLMGGESVPARLGGGFLFWSPSVMYRARSFLGPLEPVAPLPTNAIDLAFGPGSLLIVDPEGGRKAYDLVKAQRVPLSPHGVLDMATGDDERAVAVDASGRALASTDGGKTWRDVTGQMGGRPGRPCAAGTQVGFEISNKEGVWLATDGTMARGPLPEPHPSGSTDSSLKEVMFALGAGIPFGGGQALVGRGPEVRTVDLTTGAVLSTRQVEPGLSCRVLSTDDEGLAVCYQYSVKNPLTKVVSHVLGPSPRIEKTFQGTVAPAYGAGVLIVSAGCDGAHASSVACARRPGGTWTQYDAQPAVDATANPPPTAAMAAFLTPMPVVWVSREDGGVTALATKRPVKPGEQFHVARYDLPGGTPTFFDKVIAALEHYRWVVGRDGTLRGFGPAASGGPTSSSIAVDMRGHVETGVRDFTDLAAADPTHALAGDAAHRLWQTVDGGAHWIEVATPPGRWGRSEATVIAGGQAIQCSLVGCVLPATGGSWLRMGWPEDPPSLMQDARVAAPGASATARPGGGDHPTPPPEVVTAAPATPPAPVLPRLRCTLRAEPQAVQPHPAGPLREGEDSKALFGGRLLPERRGSQVFVNLPYRDQYTGPGDTIGPQSIGHGLRAIVHFPSANQSTFDLARLVQDKAVVDAWYVEPFDPSGAIVHATSSFASWAQATGRPGAKAPSGGSGEAPIRLGTGDDLTHGARPVLSSRPGHADGVLLGREGLVMWVDQTGAVRPVPASQGHEIYSGYADAHGKLFVASESSAGGTQVIEVETGAVRFRVPDALPFYPLLRSRASSYPAIPLHVFAAPDAIAVAPDGSIGILRMPSGVEPATEDDPALFLTGSSPPVELAPWSKVEMASSAACQGDREGYRAVIQTGLPWIAIEGSLGFHFRTPGMSAMVRWDKDRVCMESVEVGYREMEDSSSPTYGLKVMAVARFVGAGAEGGLVGTGREATVREPAKCALE